MNIHLSGMYRDEFRRLMERADIDIPLLRRLTGYTRPHATILGSKKPVPRSAQTIVQAYYLMDGPKRQELLKAIER